MLFELKLFYFLIEVFRYDGGCEHSDSHFKCLLFEDQYQFIPSALTSFAIFLIKPCNTVPGPTSVN